MLDFFFVMMAVGMNATGEEAAAPQVSALQPPATEQSAPATESSAQGQSSASVSIGQGTVTMGEGVIVGGAPAAAPAPAPAPTPTTPGMNMAVVPPGLVAEPQVPSGKFLTAMEVKPILNATKGNWVAIREFNGQDLLYVTHLWSWRCGLAALAISVNDEPMQNWPLPPCHADTATPNAITDNDGLPYLTLRLGAVERVSVQIVYDDLTMDAATFARNEVKMP